MIQNIKALIVILVLAAPAFYVSRQIAVSVIGRREFASWRNAWFATTAAGFLSGNYFVFAVIITMICFFARAARVASPAVFIILLFAVPLGSVPIGGFGIVNALFNLNTARLLGIVLLLPMMVLSSGIGRQSGRAGYVAPDWLVACYVLFLTAIGFQQYNVTQTMRSVTVLALDVVIPYLFFSRMVRDLADVRKVLLAFIVAVLPLSLIGVFETAKHWLLYSSIADFWGSEDLGGGIFYQARGGVLRASASASSPIVFGFIVMVAIGSALALRRFTTSRRFSSVALAILGMGLIATFSRGPWVGTMVLILVYLATSRNSATVIAKFMLAGTLLLLPLLLTPVGGLLFDLLPFVGSVDAGSIDYRTRLFNNALLVIERNAWFGSPDALSEPEMVAMTQGEGIIDVVSTYLWIALKSGVIGLGLFLSFFGSILLKLWNMPRLNEDVANCTRAMMATLVGIMVTIATVSSIDFIPYVYWSFAGLAVALIRITYKERVVAARLAQANRAVG
jgi:hypothetical protein